jgi:hypothetical protein
MPSFTFNDTFRESQWRAFRQFVLDERRDAGAREASILAEQRRIGKVRLLYATDPSTGELTQRRIGVVIDGSPTCAVAKLMQAYILLGGNPLDISMFLYPNDLECPDKGFAYPVGFSYSLQGGEGDADANIEKYKPSRVGGTRETQSEIIATNMDLLRRWTRQEMYQKRILIEERIIKLSDLYEQLDQEREAIVGATQAAGMKAIYSTDRFQDGQTVPVLVYLIDSTYREADADGRVPPNGEVGESLGQFPMLLSDSEDGSESNNAL